MTPLRNRSKPSGWSKQGGLPTAARDHVARAHLRRLVDQREGVRGQSDRVCGREKACRHVGRLAHPLAHERKNSCKSHYS